MKIKDILGEADTILNVDPAKGLVTYGDSATGISHTVPQTMLQQNQDGTVNVNTQAVAATTNPNAATQPQFKTGTQIKPASPGATMSSNPTNSDVGLGEELEDDEDTSPRTQMIYKLAQELGWDVSHLELLKDHELEELCDEHGLSEMHHDSVEDPMSSDIGGDPTDNFIRDVEVKPHVDGSYQYEAKTFGAKDELAHWLHIAGIK
jgi:hypothetical protein